MGRGGPRVGMAVFVCKIISILVYKVQYTHVEELNSFLARLSYFCQPTHCEKSDFNVNLKINLREFELKAWHRNHQPVLELQ